ELPRGDDLVDQLGPVLRLGLHELHAAVPELAAVTTPVAARPLRGGPAATTAGRAGVSAGGSHDTDAAEDARQLRGPGELGLVRAVRPPPADPFETRFDQVVPVEEALDRGAGSHVYRRRGLAGVDRPHRLLALSHRDALGLVVDIRWRGVRQDQIAAR